MIEFPVAFIGACLVVGLFGLLVAESMELADTRAALDNLRARFAEMQEDLEDQEVQIEALKKDLEFQLRCVSDERLREIWREASKEV